MDIKELNDFQLKMSKEWFGADHRRPEDFQEFMKRLQFGTIALSGEVGEFANVVKKMIRFSELNQQKKAEEKIDDLKEELADVFAYTLILSSTLGISLEDEYLKKMEKNKERFKNFKKA